ncbi:peptidylprolyl isomerase [Clostridium sp. DL1XJH146]
MNIKRIVAASLVGMSLFAFSGCNSVEKTQAKIDATVVAEVNGEEITRKDLDTYPGTIQLIDYIIQTYGTDAEEDEATEDTENADAAENTEATESTENADATEAAENTDETEEVELTEEEKIEMLATIVENNEEAADLLREQKLSYLDAIVFEKILLQESEKRELVPSEEDIQKSVDEAYEEQIAQFETEEQFIEALVASGYTEETLKDVIRTNVILEKLQEDILKDVTVDEEEIKEYYDKYKDKYPADSEDPSMYTLAHILVYTEEEAQEIKDKIDAGEDFAELAKEYSQDTGSAENGGSLGDPQPAVGHNFVQEFMDGAIPLNTGEVSDIVQSDYGYHIIKCIEKDEKPAMDYEEVKESIKATIQYNKESEAIDTAVQKMQDEADTITYEDRII